ncbi:MAG: NUDIX hydrolase [Pseudomonadales bacterium]|nr:NUDIX hydrolase [Pseudomonadales bacterium]
MAVQSWIDAPHNAAGWERLATTPVFDEPGFAAHGLKAASGAVVVEPDGRVWTVSPTNAFGGYTNTFPKGSLDAGHQLSLKANAIKEVFEESGLRVELLGFLVDTKRTTSTTRYYVARRVAGTPADMGWESQAVHLVPAKTLSHFASHPNDKPIIAALLQWIAQHPWQADR